MSCLAFMTPAQRAALANSSADGASLSAFTSPPPSPGKLLRLRSLARATSAAIRESAALAHHAPTDVLQDLAADPMASVRRCVARNERTPAVVLETLAADDDSGVRGWVAAHPATPEGARRRLASDPDPTVRAVHSWAERWTRAG